MAEGRDFKVAVAGTSRTQDYVKWAKDHELKSAELVREPENVADNQAVAVYVSFPVGGRKKIGYLPNVSHCLDCDPQQVGRGVPQYEIRGKEHQCPQCGGTNFDLGTAEKIAPMMDRGVDVRAEVFAYTGGTEDKPTTGVLLRVTTP